MTNPLFDLSGKVALITGASRGLGQYFGRALAGAGADLVITSRHLDALADFQQEIEGLGRRALPVRLDVRSEDDIEDASSTPALDNKDPDRLTSQPAPPAPKSNVAESSVGGEGRNPYAPSE